MRTGYSGSILGGPSVIIKVLKEEVGESGKRFEDVMLLVLKAEKETVS